MAPIGEESTGRCGDGAGVVWGLLCVAYLNGEHGISGMLGDKKLGRGKFIK